MASSLRRMVCALALVAMATGLVTPRQAGKVLPDAKKSSQQVPLPMANFSQQASEVDLRTKYLNAIFELGYTCKKPVRIGKNNDAGYVVCDDSWAATGTGEQKQPCQLLSYGVSKDDSMEMAIHDSHGCDVDEFDPTVDGSDGARKVPDSVHFHKEGLGSSTKTVPGLGPVDTLTNHKAKYVKPHRILMLKVDVEESEWESLSSLPESTFDSFDQLIMEAHLDHIKSPQEVASSFASRVGLLQTLKKHFYLYHTHLNNWSGKVDVPGVGVVPRAAELSFIRKGLVTPGSAPYDNHSEIDQPCNPNKPELHPSDFGSFTIH